MKSFITLFCVLLICAAVRGIETGLKGLSAFKGKRLSHHTGRRGLKTSKSATSSESESKSSKESTSESEESMSESESEESMSESEESTSESESEESMSESESKSSESKSSKSKSSKSSSKSSSGWSDSDYDEEDTVALAIAENDNLGVLGDLLVVTGLAEPLDDYEEGPFTIFAPTNSAFDALDQDLTDRLLDDEFIYHLTDLLLFHSVDGDVLESEDAEHGDVIEMASDEYVYVKVTDEETIYLRPYPFFNLEQAKVTDVDNFRVNGVVHEIAKVLLPSWIYQDLYDTLEVNGYTTLAWLVWEAGLESTLRDLDTTMTIFAPTNDAFEALDDDLLDCLANNPDILTDLILYHAIDPVLWSGAFDEMNTFTTFQGTDLMTEMTEYGLFVNDEVWVIEPDMLAINGVVHGIDTPLAYMGFTCP